MRELVLLGVAGAAGTLSRYALAGWTQRLLGDRLPFGTLAVNVLGCLLLGLIMEGLVATEVLPRALRVPLTVGFFGAFTTFSTFGFETMRYMQASNWTSAALNVAANVVLCLAATWLGIMAGRGLFGS